MFRGVETEVRGAQVLAAAAPPVWGVERLARHGRPPEWLERAAATRDGGCGARLGWHGRCPPSVAAATACVARGVGSRP